MALETLHHPLDERVFLGDAGFLGKGRRLDRDRKRGRAKLAPEGAEPIAHSGDAGAGAGDAIAEVLRVDRRLEANQVVGREALEDAVVGWDRRGDVRGRPRDMIKEADLVGKAQLAQELGHRDEVIVLDPDDVGRLQQARKTPGELLVDAEIGIDVAAREIGEIEPVVAHRPEHAIGEPVIIFVDVAAREVGDRVVDVTVALLVERWLGLGRGLAGPAEPQAAGALERGAERDGETTGAGRAGRGDGDAIGDHHQTTRALGFLDRGRLLHDPEVRHFPPCRIVADSASSTRHRRRSLQRVTRGASLVACKAPLARRRPA